MAVAAPSARAGGGQDQPGDSWVTAKTKIDTVIASGQ